MDHINLKIIVITYLIKFSIQLFQHSMIIVSFRQKKIKTTNLILVEFELLFKTLYYYYN